MRKLDEKFLDVLMRTGAAVTYADQEELDKKAERRVDQEEMFYEGKNRLRPQKRWVWVGVGMSSVDVCVYLVNGDVCNLDLGRRIMYVKERLGSLAVKRWDLQHYYLWQSLAEFPE